MLGWGIDDGVLGVPDYTSGVRVFFFGSGSEAGKDGFPESALNS